MTWLFPFQVFTLENSHTCTQGNPNEMFSTALSMEEGLRDGLIVAPLCGSLKGLL